MKVFSFNIKRRKKRVNNDFIGDYFIEKQPNKEYGQVKLVEK